MLTKQSSQQRDVGTLFHRGGRELSVHLSLLREFWSRQTPEIVLGRDQNVRLYTLDFQISRIMHDGEYHEGGKGGTQKRKISLS
jgi:hypothetical protein